MTTPAGWYPNPSGSGGQRYWDGNQWSEHFAPLPSPSPAPTKPNRTLVWVLVAFGVIVAVGSTALGNAGKDQKKYVASNSTSVAAVSAGDARTPAVGAPSVGATIGDEVRDGKFAFVVNSVARSNADLPMATPRGEWVVVFVTVTNVGDRAQSFFPTNQKLIDKQGRKYKADNMASIAMNQSGDSMILDMNPGFSVKVQVPFDTPPGTELSAVELHDSMFSGGAKVHL